MQRIRRLSSCLVLLALVGAMLWTPSAGALRNPNFDPPDITGGAPPPFIAPANGFDWSVQPRFGAGTDSRGLLDYHWNPDTATYDPNYVHPAALPVDLNGCPSPAEAAANQANPPTTTSTYDWKEVTSSGLVPVLPDPGTPAATYPAQSCAFTHTFAIDPVTATSTHTVQLTITQPTNPPIQTTYTNTVNPRDRLIVSLGDSYASGEGNPDIPQQICSLGTVQVPVPDCVVQNPKWEDQRCHRSSLAAPAQAAIAVAEADRHQSVTFLSFACSGATINTSMYGDMDPIDPYYGGVLSKPIGSGILGPYAGTEGATPGSEPDYAHPLPSQIDQMSTAVGSRHVDALLLDGGGNDIGFGPVAQLCAVAVSCQSQKVFAGDPLNASFITLDQRVQNDVANLHNSYQQLATAICNPDSRNHCSRDVGKVYLTEYPDPSRADDGNFCTNMLDDVIPWFLHAVLPGFEKRYELFTNGANHIDVANPLYGFSVSNNTYPNDLLGRTPQDEVTWAGTTVLGQLEGAVQQGAADGNATGIPWQYVTGIKSAFAHHGYCATNSWIRRAPDAMWVEGPYQLLGTTKTKGTLHPNAAGQQAITQQILSSLKPDLVPAPNGSTPPPQPFFSPSSSLTDATTGAVTATSSIGAGGWLTGCSGPACPPKGAVIQMGVFDAAGLAGAGLVMDGSPLTCTSRGATTASVTCRAGLRSDGSYVWTLSFAADGVHSLAFDVRDNNGTHGSTNQDVKIDLEDPTIPTATLSTSPASSGWFTTPVTVTFDAGDPAGGSGLQGVAVSLDGGPTQMLGASSQVPNGTSLAGAQLQVLGDGTHTVTYQSFDFAGRSSSMQTLTLPIDTTPPTITCGAADGAWHADDVSIQCTATDTISTLGTDRDGNPLTQASFSLSTSVPAGTETVNAVTGTQQVCNVAGNCATAGPVGGNMVDKAGPTIAVNTPAVGGTYYLNQRYTADYSCADASGVATCAGSLAQGAPLDTSKIGPGSFTVNATDSIGQTSQVTTSYNVVGDPTVTTLSSSQNPSTYGQSVTFSATVSPAAGSPATATPTGTVSFDEGGTDFLGFPIFVHLGSGTLNSAGVATFSTSSLGVGFSGHLITATYGGDSTYGSSTSSGLTQNVNPAPTTTTMASSANPSAFGQSVTFTATVSPTNGLGQVTFTADGAGIAGCANRSLTVVGGAYQATCTTSSLAAGNHTVSAAFSGSFGYATSAGTLSGGQSVNAVTPTITWADPAGVVYGTPLSATQLDATASVPGTFTYTPASGTVLPAGPNQALTVSFTPADTNYSPVSATVHINVSKATPTVTWANPADVVYGTPLSGTQLDATASVPGTFTYTPAAGTHLPAGSNQALTVNFTPADSSDYVPAGATVRLNVTKATPTVTWANPADIVYGTPLGGPQLDATASVPGTFSYTPGAGTVLAGGANQALSVNFTPTDASNYTAASSSAHINVIPMSASLGYNGQLVVNVGSPLTPGALLSSSASGCQAGQTVRFTLDRNPMTGANGPYTIQTGTTGSSGQAAGAPVNTNGWRPGAYTVTASFGPTTNCLAASDSATLAVGSPGGAASGAGSYSLSGSGRVNFAFAVWLVNRTANQYTGQLLLINDGRWRLTGTLSSYSKTATGQGAAGGTGNLYWWNRALNGGRGDWQLAQSGVSYTVSFDQGSNLKLSTCNGTNGQGCMGIRINYTPAAPQPNALPNSMPQPINVGYIKSN